MNPWLQQLGRSRFLTETPPYSPRTPVVHDRSKASKGAAHRGKPTPQTVQRVKGHLKDTNDARVAELRRRYKKVETEPDGSTKPKGPTDKHWF